MKLLKEYDSQYQIKNILSKSQQSFLLIKKLLQSLKPRNSAESSALSAIESNLSIIRSAMLNLSNMSKRSSLEDEQRETSFQQQNSSDDSKIDEMSSGAGGSIAGIAGGKKKNKKLVIEDEEIKESKSIKELRNIIKESLESIFNTNPSLIFEADFENNFSNSFNLPDEDPQQKSEASTGEAVLEQSFGELRKAIANKYPTIKTNKEQRESYKQHLVNMFVGELSKLKQNQDILSTNGDGGGDGDMKDAAFKAQYQLKSLPNYPNASPQDIQQGFNFAAETFNLTFTKIEEAARALANENDKNVFIQGIIQNVPAVCDLLEKQFEDLNSQDMSNNLTNQNQGQLPPQVNNSQNSSNPKLSQPNKSLMP